MTFPDTNVFKKIGDVLLLCARESIAVGIQWAPLGRFLVRDGMPLLDWNKLGNVSYTSSRIVWYLNL